MTSAPSKYGIWRNSSGQVLIFSLVFTLVIMSLSGILISLVLVYYQNGQLAVAQESALQLAEAGIDKAIDLINQPSSTYAGEANTVLGNGMFTVTISDIGSRKIIDSTGYIPNSTAPLAAKTVRVELSKSSAGVSFIYGVQVGFGGLTMTNNSYITGSVYSDGTITGATNTNVSGDAWVAGGVAASPDQQQLLQTGELNIGDIATRIDGAQSFIPDITQVISRVSFYIRKVGNPSNATIRIVPDNGGEPGSVTLASGTLNSSSVGTGYGWIDVSLTAPVQINNGETYWIVVDVPSANATRYYVWGKHDNSGYGNGIGLHSTNWAGSPAVWDTADGDFGFKTWMGGGITKIISINVGADAHANTIEDSDITGNAYYQSISGSTVSGTSFPGSADPPAIDMPITGSVINDFEAMAAAGGVITPAGGTHTISGAVNLGPVKIAGDLLIDLNSVVNIQGPVWVEGDIIVDNNVILALDSSFGADSTMLIADYPADPFSKGRIIFTNNVQIEGSGDPSSYIMMLSTYAHPTTPAVGISNNTDGAIFYSTAGTIHVNNNVSVKEVIAYSLWLSNNASVNYESGLANVNFSSGPSGGWLLKQGSWQVFNP